MSDPTTPGGPADEGAPDADADATAGAGAASAEGDANQNTALGIVFGMLGLVLMLTLEDTRVAGLPFVVLGITYFAMGIRPVVAKRGRAPADGDTPPPPTA
jgi:hypothetical protein